MILDYIDTSNIDRGIVINTRIEEFVREYNLKGTENDLCYLQNKEMTEPEKAEYISLVQKKEVNQAPVANIDLYSLLRMTRADGLPKWSLVNPRILVGNINGGVWFSGWWRRNFENIDPSKRRYVVCNNSNGHGTAQRTCLSLNKTLEINDVWESNFRGYSLTPKSGFPILPKRIRELLQSTAVANSHCTAILYQPTGWGEPVYHTPDPDPALLIRKTDKHPFQCVAVWGHDGAQIQEFTS